MKNFSDCKHDVAVSQGYDSWLDMVESEKTNKIVVSSFADIAARMYALELMQAAKLETSIVGRAGCTYGETDYDSISVSYGYSIAEMEHNRHIDKLINKLT